LPAFGCPVGETELSGFLVRCRPSFPAFPGRAAFGFGVALGAVWDAFFAGAAFVAAFAPGFAARRFRAPGLAFFLPVTGAVASMKPASRGWLRRHLSWCTFSRGDNLRAAQWRGRAQRTTKRPRTRGLTARYVWRQNSFMPANVLRVAFPHFAARETVRPAWLRLRQQFAVARRRAGRLGVASA